MKMPLLGRGKQRLAEAVKAIEEEPEGSILSVYAESSKSDGSTALLSTDPREIKPFCLAVTVEEARDLPGHSQRYRNP